MYTLNDLVQGGKYLIRVRSLNCAGWGAWSGSNTSPLSLANIGDASHEKGGSGRRSFVSNIGAAEKAGWLDLIFEEICNAMERNAADFSELFEQ